MTSADTLLNPTVAVAVTNGEGTTQQYHTIILGPQFLNSNNEFRNSSTLIHEYMHELNNMGDVQLVQKWTAEGATGLDPDPEKASASISDWIMNGCPNNKHQK